MSQSHQVLFYHQRHSPRLAYVAHYIFEELWGIELLFTADPATYSAYIGPKICYDTTSLPTTKLWLIPHPILAAHDITEQALATGLYQNTPTLCQVSPGGALPFDPFAASFYLLSRYEEYLPYPADVHGRYTASLSWSQRATCLDRPIIWEWAEALWTKLQASYPRLKRTPRSYQFRPSYDIDLPWAFRYRGMRGLARTALDIFSGKWALSRARLLNYLGRSTDPFFTFPYLHELHRRHSIRPRIFWLVAARRSAFDVNPSPNNGAFQQLITDTHQWADNGLHPSYAAFDDAELLAQERQTLQQLSGHTITHSRQHFLRLRLPDTYRQLLAAGIRHDYTMGYADMVGYRAGTSEPFYWFDLEKNKVTNLRVHPFVAMDVSLRKYLALSPQEASERLQNLRTYQQNNKLTFSTLWHNSSFSKLHDWEGWREVYESLF